MDWRCGSRAWLSVDQPVLGLTLRNNSLLQEMLDSKRWAVGEMVEGVDNIVLECRLSSFDQVVSCGSCILPLGGTAELRMPALESR
jgi:hypothetical protein